MSTRKNVQNIQTYCAKKIFQLFLTELLFCLDSKRNNKVWFNNGKIFRDIFSGTFSNPTRNRVQKVFGIPNKKLIKLHFS